MESTMDPVEKLVPSGLGRPVKQQGLTHACWLESARQLDQPRIWWNRVKQRTGTCSEPTLRVLSDVLLQQVARRSETTVEKMSKRWETRDTVSGAQWVSIAKVIPSACSIRPRGTWEKVAAHGGKKNGEEERVVPSGSNPDALRKKTERGAEEGYQTLVNRHVDWAISMGEVVCAKEQHQVRGREGGLKSKGHQDRQSRGRPSSRDPRPFLKLG